MIDPITSRLDELRKFAIKVNAFIIFLNALNVFLIFAIILRVFGIAASIATCPAAVYLLLAAVFQLQKVDEIDSITKEYPSLDERLQTARDNRRVQNIIVKSLITDVSKRMDAMTSSSFLDSGLVSSKVIVSIVLIFTFLSINFINIEDLGLSLNRFVDPDLLQQIEDYTGFKISSGENFHPEGDDQFETKHKVEDDLLGGSAGGELPGYNEGPIPGDGGGVGMDSDPDLYGEASSAQIEGKNVDLELHPEYGGEIEIKDVEEERVQGEFSGDLKGKSAEIPAQEPVEYRELIRRYFQSLQKISQD